MTKRERARLRQIAEACDKLSEWEREGRLHSAAAFLRPAYARVSQRYMARTGRARKEDLKR